MDELVADDLLFGDLVCEGTLWVPATRVDVSVTAEELSHQAARRHRAADSSSPQTPAEQAAVDIFSRLGTIANVAAGYAAMAADGDPHAKDWMARFEAAGGYQALWQFWHLLRPGLSAEERLSSITSEDWVALELLQEKLPKEMTLEDGTTPLLQALREVAGL